MRQLSAFGCAWNEPISYHQASLGPFGPSDRLLRFEFHCGHPHCPGHGACCKLGIRSVEIVD